MNMTSEETIAIVPILKALGDDTRAKIFAMLKGGELCACKILEALQITQPTLSHHMKILCGCGLVAYRKDWKWTHYSIDQKTLESLKNWLQIAEES